MPDSPSKTSHPSGIASAKVARAAARQSMDTTTAVLDEIELERFRQIQDKGHTHAEDDALRHGLLAVAAMNFLKLSIGEKSDPRCRGWLLRAAALTVAEIERFDREALKASQK